MLRIVHLSDIHLNEAQTKDTEEFIIKGLINDLSKFHLQKAIDLILITGDLIDQGGASYKDADIAFLTFEEKVLEPICQALKLLKEQIFFVPGNHDVQRHADRTMLENGLTSTLTSTEKVNEHIDSGDKLGVQRVHNFKDFESAYHSNFKGERELTYYQSCFNLHIGELWIGITCFNSSWRCYDSLTDKGKILLGERQITDARRLTKDCDLRIALIHHPVDWLAPFEAKNISDLLQKDYHFLFCGHVHEGSSWVNSTMFGNQFLSVAPHNWTYNFRNDKDIYSNGYSIIDYDESENQVIVHNRRYSYKKETYDPNTELGDSEGKAIFRFPDLMESTKQSFQLLTAEKITKQYLEVTNEHLLSFNSDTKAPKTIQEIFVAPLLVDKPQEDKAKRKYYCVDDLCKDSENLLILGSKESGKTILLDRILIELTQNIYKYKKIPVLINFENFTHSRFETSISHFLSLSITMVNETIANNNIILLIDNLDLKKDSKLLTLEKFIMDNPNIQIIACTNYLIEGEVPLEVLEYPIISAFKTIYIKDFEAKQIRELMHKWFKNNTFFDTAEKLQKLLQFIINLNISRTPLAVSMFLWIFEQQGIYKPVNNATMLQNFIERLFKKQSKKEIYSETFDFTNKERLLTSIARKMYDIKRDNYGLTYYELRDFIRENIAKKKFELIINDEVILQEFLSKGILSAYYCGNEVFVRFKFNCFFQYFLMKNMDIDPGFKAFVLQEENFLYFTEEIDYYTGLKRDQADILELLTNRMNGAFNELITKIEELKFGFDTMFETKRSIASTLDSSFVKKVTNRDKPKEEDLDQMHDNMLDSVKPDTGIEKKEDPIDNIDTLWRHWVLTAKVLKNTEETDFENLKSNAFDSVITCSMAFATLYKFLLKEHLRTHKNNVPEYFTVMNRLLPLAHQHSMYSFVGTAKLLVVIQEKIEKEIRDETVSDLQKFLSVFLYSDLKGKDYHKYIKLFMSTVKRSYMFDMVLLKILNYYYMRSSTKQSDSVYENLIADVIVDSKGSSKNEKGKIIRSYRLMRHKTLNEEEGGLIS